MILIMSSGAFALEQSELVPFLDRRLIDFQAGSRFCGSQVAISRKSEVRRDGEARRNTTGETEVGL
jgi:hypothetical protein